MTISIGKRKIKVNIYKQVLGLNYSFYEAFFTHFKVYFDKIVKIHRLK
jgi:hypothetical protein